MSNDQYLKDYNLICSTCGSAEVYAKCKCRKCYNRCYYMQHKEAYQTVVVVQTGDTTIQITAPTVRVTRKRVRP